jgi:hypothetical protein
MTTLEERMLAAAATPAALDVQGLRRRVLRRRRLRRLTGTAVVLVTAGLVYAAGAFQGGARSSSVVAGDPTTPTTQSMPPPLSTTTIVEGAGDGGQEPACAQFPQPGGVATADPGQHFVVLACGPDGVNVSSRLALRPGAAPVVGAGVALVQEVLQGPTPDELTAGFVSPWGEGALAAQVRSEGSTLVIDLSRDVIGRVQSTTNSLRTLTVPLLASAFLDESVTAVRFEIDGDATAFAEWSQGETSTALRENEVATPQR